MKKINIYWLGFFGLLASLLSSCDTDNEGVVYHPTGTEAYFSNEVITHEMNGDEDSFDVVINRGYFPGESVVEIVSSDTSGLFTLPTSVTFSDKSETATLKVSVKGELESAVKYAVNLGIAEKDASVIHPVHARLKIVKYVWESLGEGVFSSDFFEKFGHKKYWSQEVLKVKNTNIYRLPDCYAEGYNITFSIEDGEVTDFADQATGYVHPSYGMVYVNLMASLIQGNQVMMLLNFYCSAGSFGPFVEIVELP